MSEWKPIETAPRDEQILMYVLGAGEKRAGRVMFGRVIEYDDGERVCRPEGCVGPWQASHWMPLPEAPSKDA